MHIADLPTPAVLVETSRLTRNLSRMQAMANARGLRLRPHAKTHKSPFVAALQIKRGAVGICCAKLGEAEVFADAGVADIRFARFSGRRYRPRPRADPSRSHHTPAPPGP